jgi:hypothetical protein
MLIKNVYLIASSKDVSKANFSKTYSNLSNTGRLKEYLLFTCESSGHWSTSTCHNLKTGNVYASRELYGGSISDENGNGLGYKVAEGWYSRHIVHSKRICNGNYLTLAGVRRLPDHIGGYDKSVRVGVFEYNGSVQSNKLFIEELYTPLYSGPKMQVSPY